MPICKTRDTAEFKKYLKKYCQNGMEYFCDGTPNLSRIENKDDARPIKPCRYIGSLNCPVNQAYENKTLPKDLKCEKNENTIHTPNSADID